MAEVYDDEEYIYDAVDAEEYDVEAEEVDALAALDDPRGFDALLRNVQATKDRDAPPPVRADLTRLPVVVDDYVRNFLVKHQLTETLNSFEQEWYEKYGTGPEEEPEIVSDVYLENAKLVDKTTELQRELAKHKETSERAMKLWDRVKKERDLHRTNHSRVLQEKTRLTTDLKRMQAHNVEIEPTVTELRQKYESVQKEKMLLKLEKDKLIARVSKLEENVRELEGQQADGQGAAKKAAGKETTKKAAPPTWPADVRPNPHATNPAKAPAAALGWSCRNTIKAHAMAASCVAVHPKKPVAASCSDDGSWRLHSLPQGELIMSGEGHEDWIAGIAVHPKGTMCATASGDKTVRLWDFASRECKHIFKVHTDSAWCVDFQETGELLASGGLDHTARIYDLIRMKTKQTLRGHVDAVNSCAWVPYTNTLATASGDKTVSLWDARANFCVQTFYGHHNSVSKVAVSARGDAIASCDADGIVITWDMRMITQKQSFNFGPQPCNSVSFDKSGDLLAAACEDGMVRLVNLVEEKVAVLKGHEDAVQSAVFDPTTNGFLVSGGSDCTVRYWS